MAPPGALIVDDDPGFLLGLAELVRREGFAVASANTLKQAREEIATNQEGWPLHLVYRGTEAP